MFPLLIIYLFSALFTDIIAASLYAAFGLTEVNYLRLGREGLAFALFIAGFLNAPCPPRVRLLTSVYFAFIAVYSFVGFNNDMGLALLAGSAAKLAFPIFLIFGAMGAIETPRQMMVLCWSIVCLALTSLLFGLWDIRHTDFWAETIDYGSYLYEVKGVLIGYLEEYMLPFNFFGFEGARRAAGLVAAPLAQGSVLATAGVLAFALWREKQPWLAVAALGIFCFGIYQSGTRGALLIVLLAIPAFLIVSTRRVSGAVRDLMLVGLLVLAGAEVISFIYDYTVNLDDGSTIGHLTALQDNLAGLGQVVIFGAGVGEAGAVTADAGEEIAGGGEGALFTIIYQLGLPGGIVFLALYSVMAWQLLKTRRQAGDLNYAVLALMIGAASSMVISEHIFSVSAMAPFWLLVGASLSLARRYE
ncbi:O-antigen ligase family protein [Lacibacterium aquatile]|uniref:O-antigen ligase family protein n=1 Tax=Lacibacterium aquatile TaxID=1168082 RepID=A0ABW5DVJ3_9PROT